MAPVRCPLWIRLWPETVEQVASKESNKYELIPKFEAGADVDYTAAMSEYEVLLPRHKRVTSG